MLCYQSVFRECSDWRHVSAWRCLQLALN
uniref:Uncharacterized protein n=1 Tax=Rhizophora mucronata TaxID=61149 RepID=A0A2P2J011_RHIMU